MGKPAVTSTALVQCSFGLAPATLANGLQTAWQASAGVELTLPEDITGTVSVFHNAFFNMTDALGSGGDADPTSDQRARGRAIGLEVFLRRRLTKRLGGFISYTLSRSTRELGGVTRYATFDRTHVASAALSYDLGRKWRFGGRFTFYTGLPKAPDPTSDSTRLDPFYRLDLRLEKRWNFKSWWISFVAEWMNVTLHKEQVSTTCTLSGCTAQEIGPVTIPSLGAEGGF